jgi:hypothetical protein
MEDFGPGISFNETAASAIEESIGHIYTADEIALILGALSAAIAAVIYSVKNVKHSSCCGGVLVCDQRTELPPSKNSVIIESSNV